MNEAVFAEIHDGGILSEFCFLHEKRGLRPFSLMKSLFLAYLTLMLQLLFSCLQTYQLMARIVIAMQDL